MYIIKSAAGVYNNLLHINVGRGIKSKIVQVFYF